MLTPDDKGWILDNFALHKDIERLEAQQARTEGKIDRVLTKLDAFVGKIADLDQENKMGARTLHRHGVNIEELAKATGMKISG